MIIPAPNDVAFSMFGFPVYWYGIIMAGAIFVAIIVANKMLNFFYSKDIILEFAPVIIIMGILGARLYFCMLNPTHYLANPLEIFDIREGGLSVHGGILGGILSVIFMVKKYKIPYLPLLDCMSVGTILGQAIGRWGNYFNSEAYGLPVAGQNWGLFIPSEHRIAELSQFNLFHPTFLYESILDLIAFFILILVLKKFGAKYSGLTFFSYLIFYALIRFFVEQIRVDSALNIGAVPIASIASIILFAIGIIGLIYLLRMKFNDKY